MDRCKCPACGHEWDKDSTVGTVTDDSAAGLAQLWCFHLTRRKLGGPRDLPQDIAPEMQNLIDLGIHPARIRTEILRKGRDRGEFMHHFKQRFGLGFFLKKAPLAPAPQTQHYKPEPPPSDEERERAKQAWLQARGIGEMPPE